MNEQSNTIQEARRFIYEEMVRLREGDVSIEEALAQSKLAAHLIDSYRVEVKSIEVALASSKIQIEYQEAKKLLG